MEIATTAQSRRAATHRISVAAARMGLLAACLLCAPVDGASFPGAPSPQRTNTGRIERAVRAVLDAQVAAWNRGDIDGFMDGYVRSDATRFASGADVLRGWQTVRDRYRERYSTREKMGRLTFSDLEITVLSPASALVFGRWRLERVGDTPNGLFTLHFARTRAGWRIVSDHTTSAETAPPAVSAAQRTP